MFQQDSNSLQNIGPNLFQEHMVDQYIECIQPARIRSTMKCSASALAYFAFLPASGCIAPTTNLICGRGTTQRVTVTASTEFDTYHGVQQTCLDTVAAVGYSGDFDDSHFTQTCQL